MTYFKPALLLMLAVPSLAIYHRPPIVPRGRDYETKVMIFHDDTPAFGSWNPKHGQPFPQPLGHTVTKQDIIDNIAKGLLRRKLTPTEIEQERNRANSEGLNAIHQQNIFHAKQKESAHQLLEEMRLAKAADMKKQQELRKQLKKQRKHQPQLKYQPKRQPQSKYQPQQRQPQQNQRSRPLGPIGRHRG